MSKTAWTWTARVTERSDGGTMYEVAQEFPGLRGAWWTVWVPRHPAEPTITSEASREVSASSKTGAKVLRTITLRYPDALNRFFENAS